jgi:hypothetical protein
VAVGGVSLPRGGDAHKVDAARRHGDTANARAQSRRSPPSPPTSARWKATFEAAVNEDNIKPRALLNERFRGSYDRDAERRLTCRASRAARLR